MYTYVVPLVSVAVPTGKLGLVNGINALQPHNEAKSLAEDLIISMMGS
jgi:hypothetical protein